MERKIKPVYIKVKIFHDEKVLFVKIFLQVTASLSKLREREELF